MPKKLLNKSIPGMSLLVAGLSSPQVYSAETIADTFSTDTQKIWFALEANFKQ